MSECEISRKRKERERERSERLNSDCDVDKLAHVISERQLNVGVRRGKKGVVALVTVVTSCREEEVAYHLGGEKRYSCYK